MKSAPQPTLQFSPCLPGASLLPQRSSSFALFAFQPLTRKPEDVQRLSFQPLAASLPSFCDSHPLFSVAYSLFCQNTRGGYTPENPSFGINNFQTLFSRSVCNSVNPPLPSASPWLSNSHTRASRSLFKHPNSFVCSRRCLIKDQVFPTCKEFLCNRGGGEDTFARPYADTPATLESRGDGVAT